MTLMQGVEPEEVGCHRIGRDGASTCPTESGRVVGQSVRGFLTHVDLTDQDVVCGDMGGKFQVRIGESAMGIVETDNGVGRLGFETMTPQ